MKLSAPEFRSRLLPISLGQIIGISCGIIGVKITSHLISPADYGLYGLFLSATPLGMWVVHIGLIKFTQRHWGESTQRSHLLQELQPAFLRKLPWLALASLIVAWLIAPNQPLSVFAFLMVSATLLSAAAVIQAALQSAREHWRDFAVHVLASVTRTFLPPLFYLLMGGSILALYGGLTVHALLVAGFAGWALRAYWKRPTTSATPQLTASYTGSLFIWLALASWVMLGINRWIIAGFFGPAEAGYFMLASNISIMAAGLLGTIFTQYFQPGIFAAPHATPTDRQNLARHVDKIAVSYWIAALVGLNLLSLVAPWFVGPLISEKFRPALPYIVPAGSFLVALLTNSFYHILLLATKREKACAPLDLSAAGLLALGCLATAAWGGETGLVRWLYWSPLVPWLLTRPLARHYLFKSGAGDGSATAR